MIGSLLMCAMVSLIGVLVFVRKKSLLGETLSHAAYPGLMGAGMLLTFFSPSLDEDVFFILFLGAFLAILGAFFLLRKLISVFCIKQDAAFCFVLSGFFGVGVLLASAMQKIRPLWYKQIQTLLYGQTATLTDEYVVLYAVLLLFVALFLILFYRSLSLVYFDPLFAKQVEAPMRFFEGGFMVLLALAILVAMKSVGIVLFSGMLVAPPLAARRMSHRLSTMLVISSLIGTVSGFLGNYLSVKLSEWYRESGLLFPTGPMIVLTASFFCFLSLLLFKGKKKQEKASVFLALLADKKQGMTLQELSFFCHQSSLRTFFEVRSLQRKGILAKGKTGRICLPFKEEGRL